MFIRRLFFCLCFLFTFSAVRAIDHPRFGQETSDLKPDPAAHFGTLPNGLRYVILANKEPRERASLRLLVTAGSLYEKEDQRGLAHFLEHMAFNGSTHYPPGTLVKYFQRLGMSFGGDTNAYTSFDHTAYQIELPDTKPQTLEEGFRVFSDFAGGLLLAEDQVEKERPIILAEKRDRDSVDYRQFVAEFEFLLGDTRLPKRLPIGLAPVIEGAKRPAFADLYDTWYRPEKMAVIAVGDFDPATVEKQIAAAFGDLKPRAPARPEPDLGKVEPLKQMRVNYHTEPEAPATTVAIQTVLPVSFLPDTSAQRLHDLPRDLALAILNRRFSILAKKENAPFSQATAQVNDGFDLFRNASVELVCKPEQWADALAVGDQELRRALEYGFQPAELAEAVANEINGLEQAVKTAPTRRSQALASSLVSALMQGDVFTTPADDLALLKPALDKITPDQCTAALREAFATSQRYVSVMGNAKIEAKSGDATSSPNAQILAAYEKSLAVKVVPPEQLAAGAFGYTDFGPAGKIAEQHHVDDLDVTLATFTNGVRLNVKKTDFQANRIQLSVRVGAGELIEPRDKPGLSFFTGATFTSGGLGKHSVDDLERILAGKNVGVGFNVGTDALVFQATTTREDLLLQLQLIAAYMTDPGYRPESLRGAQKEFEQLYNSLEHTPSGPLQAEVPRLLANGDSRFGLPPKDVVLSRTLDEARAWLAPQFKDGAVEIALVGDLDPTAATDAVAKTFGALPARQPKPPYTEERKVSFPPQPIVKEFTVQTEIPKSIVALYWPTTDATDIKRTRRLRLLSDVFSDRLRVKIREELGAAYSPDAASAPSETYRNYGLLYTYVTVDPAKAAKVVDAIVAIADDLAKKGVTADELERAKKPILTSLRESARTNGYWLGAVLSSAQEFPERLDWSRSRYADNEAITTDDLNALARQFLPPERASRFTVRPNDK